MSYGKGMIAGHLVTLRRFLRTFLVGHGRTFKRRGGGRQMKQDTLIVHTSDYSAGSWRISSSSAEAGLCRVTRSRRRRNGRSTTMCSSNATEKHVTA